VRDPFFERRPERMPLERLLPRVGSAVARHVQRAVAEHGLTPTSLGVLGVLSDRDGLSHRELAGHLGVTPATLTPVVDALEVAGALRRDRDRDDRRVVRLSITTAGRERLRTASVQVTARMRERMPRPAPEHAEIIRGYLLAVLAALDEDDAL
jgi:MarR family transcriptional regulator, organic hydroperoxide resistance regulator